MWGLLLTTTLFVFSQHYASFRAAQAAAEKHQQDVVNAVSDKQKFAAVAAQLAPPPPENLLEYLQEESKKGRPLFSDVTARGGWAWASWAFDGFLVLTAAAFVVVPALSNHIAISVIAGIALYELRPFRAIAKMQSAPLAASRTNLLSARDDMFCSLARVAADQMLWTLFVKATERTAPRQTHIWLTVAQRQAVTAILDQPSARGGTES